MVDRHVMLEAEKLSERDDDREDHPDSGEDRARDEVGREDRGVPSGRQRHREVERHHRVHGQHERSGERREKEIRAREMSPFAIRVPPAEGENAQHSLPHRIRFAVAQHGNTRHEAHVQKRRRDRQIREDREYVPDEGTLELRPDVSPVGIGNQPEEFPRTPEMQNREQSRRHDRKNSHRLGASVDRRSESGAEQVEDRRDERPGVADTDPEDEGDDVDAPHHRRVVARHTEPVVNLPAPRADADQEEEDRDAEAHEPRDRRVQRPDDFAIYLLVVAHRRQLDVGGGDVGTHWALCFLVVYRPGHRCHQRGTPAAVGCRTFFR